MIGWRETEFTFYEGLALGTFGLGPLLTIIALLIIAWFA